MGSGFREFLGSRNGRFAAIAVVVLGLAAVGYSIYANMGSAASEMANQRVFVDVKTGQIFTVTLKPGVPIPTKGPSGGDAVEAERCYWTKDGKVKDEPTYVALNQYKGLPEPTFCPDCGRLVRVHNPPPITGAKPPPTKAEYDARNERP